MFAIVVFTTLLAGFAAAQNSTTLDPNSVPLTQRNQWCNGERNNCPKLCGGPVFIKENTCFGDTLKYTCTCTNGTAPLSIDQYLDTLPNFVCQEQFRVCNKDTPGSSDCKECGKLEVSSVPSSTTSGAAAATSTAASSGTQAPAPAETGNAAAGRLAGLQLGAVVWVWTLVAGGVLAGAIVL